MNTWAIIPVKPLGQAKSRLARVLTPAQRAALMRDCLQHVIQVLAQVPAITCTAVISADSSVLALARANEALAIRESRVRGLNAAVSQAVAAARAGQASRVLILPADLPLVRPPDIELMLLQPLVSDEGSGDAKGHTAQMAICSDTRRDGTNALLLEPVVHFTFRYGPGSFGLHLDEAKRLGLQISVIHADGLKFDLDTEEDWAACSRLAQT